MHKLPINRRWYADITRYQWLVLVIASLGWVFDVFEGQIFVASMNEAMPALLPRRASEGQIAFYNNIAFAAFLAGGALGGVLFGALADRFGRKRTMAWTIWTYSIFTCFSAVAGAWWQLAGFRFLVALGVGGEWAVASALVAEVFPARARAQGQSIFHASSVLGTFLSVAAGAFIVGNPYLAFSIVLFGKTWDVAGWRLGFLLGAAPALLILWIRLSLRESEVWLSTRAAVAAASPRAIAPVIELFTGTLRRRTLVAMGLATVGLATFWGVSIYGKDVMRKAYEDEIKTSAAASETATANETARTALLKRGEMFGMFLVTAGTGLGLLCFGPLAERLGRRGAFLFYQCGGVVSSLVLFNLSWSVAALTALLPIFGFLVVGMHAGFAVYFPELFPTHLRSTGGGFCFNIGRLIAAPVLFLSGWLRKDAGLSLPAAASALSLLFVAGIVVLAFAPETRGQELPE